MRTKEGKVFKSKHILVDYFLWGISCHSLESSPLPLLSSAELTFKPTLENVAEKAGKREGKLCGEYI